MTGGVSCRREPNQYRSKERLAFTGLSALCATIEPSPFLGPAHEVVLVGRYRAGQGKSATQRRGQIRRSIEETLTVLRTAFDASARAQQQSLEIRYKLHESTSGEEEHLLQTGMQVDILTIDYLMPGLQELNWGELLETWTLQCECQSSRAMPMWMVLGRTCRGLRSLPALKNWLSNFRFPAPNLSTRRKEFFRAGASCLARRTDWQQ
jgi:hypothetical protein